MKVRTDQLEALRQQQEQNKVKPKGPEGESFGDLLSQELGQAETEQLAAQEATGTMPPPPGARAMGVGQVVETQATESAAQVEQTGQTGPTELQVMERIENVLGKWQGYAESLAGPESGLKQAYGQLEAITGEVNQIKQDLADGPAVGEELQGVVNELEIMAATETFKFNRGDYL